MSRRQIQHNSLHLNSVHLLITNIKDQNWLTIWKYISPTFHRISEYSELERTQKDHLVCYSLIAAGKISIQHIAYGYTVAVFLGCFLMYLRDKERQSMKQNFAIISA